MLVNATEMLKKAKNNAGILADKIEWYQMDAQRFGSLIIHLI